MFSKEKHMIKINFANDCYHTVTHTFYKIQSSTMLL